MKFGNIVNLNFSGFFGGFQTCIKRILADFEVWFSGFLPYKVGNTVYKSFY